VNIKYFNYSYRLKPQKSRFNNNPNLVIMDINKANFCLEIFAENEAKWRLCSDKSSRIMKLQMQIQFNIVLSSHKFKRRYQALNKFLMNSRTKSDHFFIKNFNWRTQRNWPGYCKSKFIQSPINITKESVCAAPEKPFKINYNFLDTFVKIEKRYSEVIIKFTNDPGILIINKGSRKILFKPKFLSFRFPGEHIILGKKYSGEILMHCDELNPDKKRRLSNGLIITMPLDGQKAFKNLKSLEELNLDFWKFSLSKKNSYTPKDYKTRKPLVFSLSKLMFIAMKNSNSFYFYYGSKTTPPCEEFVYHLILNNPIKISECQLKILRENSLLDTTTPLIHARLPQLLNQRKVYTIGTNFITFNPIIEKEIPEDFFILRKKMNGDSLLPKKLTTMSKQKAIKCAKRSIRKGKLSKKIQKK